MKMLPLRVLVLGVYVIAFLISLGMLTRVNWQYMTPELSLTFSFSLLVAFSGVLLAYIVYADGEVIDKLDSARSQQEQIALRRKEAGDSAKLPEETSINFTISLFRRIGDKPLLDERESKRGDIERMIADIVRKAQELLPRTEFLEIIYFGNVFDGAKIALKEKLGGGYIVTLGESGLTGNKLYVERV